MNVKLRVLSAGALFFIGSMAYAQTTKKDTVVTKETKIEEVVMVGYSNKKKEAITTAVGTVKAAELNNVPVGNFVQNLGGRIAGVDVMIGSGQPGTGGNIIIRGAGSINGGTTPLYVVDGVPLNSTAFAGLNPNDFEEVSVLKDAAAKAQYGAAGGAGVILVKTKSGKKGALRVQYTGQAGIAMKGKYKYQLMNAEQWLDWNQKWGNFSEDDVAYYQERPELYTDWSKVFFRTGRTSSNDISVSGGSENTNYYVSLAQFSQDGIALNSALDRYTLNTKITSGNGRNFRFGVNSSMSFNKTSNITGEAGVFTNNPFFAVNTAPVLTPYNPDGSYAVNQGLFGQSSLALNYGARALEQTQEGARGRKQIKLISSVFGEYDFDDHFSARVMGGVDFTQNNSTTYNNPNTYYGSTTNPGRNGSLTRSIANWTSLTSNARLSYKNTFDDVHNFSAYILGEYVGRFRESLGYTGYNVAANTPASIITSATLIPALSGGSVRFTTLAALGSLSYNYDNRYFFDANVRREASSQFSKTEKAGTFGGVSAAWAINKENFMSENNIFNELKLRGSIGWTGNTGDPTALNPYNDLQYYGYGSLYDTTRSLSVGTPLNENYKWEKERQYNIGLDFGLFKNRLWGSVDYYDRLTSDLYVTYSLSATSGFGALDNWNAGKMSNKGIEVDLHGDIVRNKDLKVSLFANFAYNKNRITDLGQVNQFESGTSIIRVGEALGSHFIVGWSGVNPQTGAPIYQDVNGNPTEVYDAINNKTGWGTFYAPYMGGFGLDLNYKGFSLSSQFQWKSDFSRFNNQRFFQENPSFWYLNQNVNQLDIWTTPGQVTDVQGAEYKVEFSSKFIEDASFVRLKNIRLGYDIPKDLLRGVVNGITIFAEGTNLYTWTKWTGFDPDDDNNIAQYEYPTPRVISLGTTITF